MIEENIIKDVINHFRSKKEINDNIIKNIINLFRFKKKNKSIKVRTIRDIMNLCEPKENYKPAREDNSWSNNYIIILIMLNI